MEAGKVANEDTITLSYVAGNRFKVATWWGPETLMDKDEHVLGIWGWGDGDGFIDEKLFKAGELFLVQPGMAGKPTLQISGGVKTWTPTEAIARIEVENGEKTSCGNPFPVAYGLQEVKAYDGEALANEDTFTLIYVGGNKYNYVTWWGPETLIDKDEKVLGIWGWGDGDGYIDEKEFSAGEGFLVQPGTGNRAYLGFPNPFYKGE